MAGISNIHYLAHNEIDNKRWDQCITSADNGLIYGYSFYLDHMARHWDALVLDDYAAVMPLTWNKKYGIHYLHQPAFTASLGVFGQGLKEKIVSAFIDHIPQKFKLIEISLNHGNLFERLPNTMWAMNYILNLKKPYEELYRDYRENHRRNIQKSIQEENTVIKNVSVDEVIRLNREQMRGIAPVRDIDYVHLKQVSQLLYNRNGAITYGVINNQDELLSSCVFFFSHGRAYYILVGNHHKGKASGTSHALIDAFIKDHAGQDLILDFEGSDIESLALFYNGFGATKETYPVIRWNRLPWWARWWK